MCDHHTHLYLIYSSLKFGDCICNCGSSRFDETKMIWSVVELQRLVDQSISQLRDSWLPTILVTNSFSPFLKQKCQTFASYSFLKPSSKVSWYYYISYFSELMSHTVCQTVSGGHTSSSTRVSKSSAARFKNQVSAFFVNGWTRDRSRGERLAEKLSGVWWDSLTMNKLCSHLIHKMKFCLSDSDHHPC